ncbi:MAG: hypothetical protein ABEN55_22625 [Bradymonadaceae bacterium]
MRNSTSCSKPESTIHALILPVAHVVYGVAEGDESGDEELMGRKIAEVTVEDGREQERGHR